MHILLGGQVLCNHSTSIVITAQNSAYSQTIAVPNKTIFGWHSSLLQVNSHCTVITVCWASIPSCCTNMSRLIVCCMSVLYASLSGLNCSTTVMSVIHCWATVLSVIILVEQQCYWLYREILICVCDCAANSSSSDVAVAKHLATLQNVH